MNQAILDIKAEKKFNYGTVTVTTITNPFRPFENLQHQVDLHGRELIEYLPKDTDFVVSVNGKHTEDFNQIVVANTNIVVSPYVADGGGGGKNPLAMVAMVALMVVAPYATFALSMATGVALGATAASLVTGAIMVGGAMLINSVLPPSMPDTAALGGAGTQESPTYNWGGIQTSKNINAPIPVLYGEQWVGGTIINEYVDLVGSDEWYHVQIALCHGTIYGIQESDIRINDNLLNSYVSDSTSTTTNNVSAWYEYRDGSFDQSIMEGFGDSYFTNSQNRLVTNANSVQVTTTSTDINKLGITIAFNAGLYEVETTTGDLLDNSVSFTIEYRKVGATGWTNITTDGYANDIYTKKYIVDVLVYEYSYIGVNLHGKHYFDSEAERDTWIGVRGLSIPIGTGKVVTYEEWVHSEGTVSTSNTLTVTANTRNPVRVKYSTSQLTSGQYEIRVTRATADSDAESSTISDRLYLGSIDEINTADVNYGGIALLGLHIKATDQLSSKPNIKVNVRRRGITDNPSDIVRDMLTNTNYGAGIPLSQIDTTALTAFRDYCNDPTANYSYDTVNISNPDLIGYYRYYYWYYQVVRVPYAQLPTGVESITHDSLDENTFSATFNLISGGTKTYQINNLYKTYRSGVYQYFIFVSYYDNPAPSTSSVDISIGAKTSSYDRNTVLRFNGVIDTQRNLWDSVQDVARIGRGNLIVRGTQYSVIYDAPSPVRHLFNDSNILDDSFNVEYIGNQNVASEVEIQFSDRALYGEMNQISVIDNDLYNSTTKQNKTTVQLRGCTSKEEAIIYGRYLLACNKYIKRTVSFQADIDSLAATVGDVIAIQNNIPQWGTGGRVVSQATNIVTLDQDITIAQSVLDDGTKKYVMRVRYSNNDTIAKFDVLNSTAETTNLIQISDSSLISSDDVYTFGIEDTALDNSTLLARITDISRDMDSTKTITAVEYNESILDFDFTNDVLQQVNTPSKPVVQISNLQLSESLSKRTDGTIVPFIHLEWDSTARNGEKYNIYYGTRLSAFSRIVNYTTLATNVETPFFTYDAMSIPVNTTVYFKVVLADKTSVSLYNSIVFVGESDSPNPVTNVTVSEVGNIFTINWDYSSPPLDFKEYHIYNDDVFYGATTSTYFVTNKITGSTQKKFSVYAVDRTGNKSAEAFAYITAELPNPITTVTKSGNYEYFKLVWDTYTKPADFNRFVLTVGANVYYTQDLFYEVPIEKFSTDFTLQVEDTGGNLSYEYVDNYTAQYLDDIANVRNFFDGNKIAFTWDKDDNASIQYVIKQGNNWTIGGVVYNSSNNVFYPSSTGEYVIKQTFKNSHGYTFESQNVVTFSVEGDLSLQTNVIEEFDEKNEGWLGSFTNALVTYDEDPIYDNSVTIASNDTIDDLADWDSVVLFDNFGSLSYGIYESPNIVTLTASQVCKINMNIQFVARDADSLIDLIADFDSIADLDGNISTKFKLTRQINISNDGVTWAGWKTFENGSHIGKEFKFRVELYSYDTAVKVYLTEMFITIDMPDRLDKGSFTTGAALYSFSHTPTFNAIPKTVLTIVDGVAGDDLVLTNETASGFDVGILNSGSYVARTVNYIAQGY